MTLTNLVNQGYVQTKPRYTSIFPMAVIYDKGEPMVIKQKGEKADRNTLEKILGSSEEAAKGEYSLNRIEELDNEYISSGKYEQLCKWCAENGLKIPEKSISYAISKKNKNAIAFTAPGTGMIGVNTYFDEKIRDVVNHTGLDESQAAEISIAHEYIHNAQDIEKFGNNRMLIEADCHLKTAQLFYDISEKSSDEQTKQRYADMAEVCLGSYYGVVSAMKKQHNGNKIIPFPGKAEISDYLKAA
ncbi:hypothetical protein KY345_02225 [Candidatus Woesearchaeota archaeon]|nr:hypothetical protein [Candidatus Woesearchaeota archaeon]